MDAASIRIDAPLVAQNQGKIVRIIGTCESFDSSSNHAVLKSNGSISLVLNSGDSLDINKNYEIIGKVNTDASSVRVLSIIELSDNINFEAVQKLVSYVQKVPELYY
ncbi:putative replication factor A protein 3 [[Candida] railenensis]|uniref:Replication factor A protein 3 n=1 Tax=[Candida] railenensis TaxID=45579 RepID=A0A9P0QM99_9ASCO|nr:putative replication factor A protein 3 [[Candida] railenensis]